MHSRILATSASAAHAGNSKTGSQLLAKTAPAAYFSDHIIAELADHSLPMAMATATTILP
jgi:hypothetical protein